MCGIFSVLNHEINNNIYKSFLLGQNRGPEYTNLSIGGSNDSVILGFHRLAINGLDSESSQPFFIDNIKLICNGEIYNFSKLASQYNIQLKTNSDCEIIIHLYKLLGIERMLQALDGVFAFILVDNDNDLLCVARDRFGVRPLFEKKIYDKNTNSYVYAFASDLIVLSNLNLLNEDSLVLQDRPSIFSFNPASYSIFTKISNKYNITKINQIYYSFPLNNHFVFEDIYNLEIVNLFSDAIKKRVIGTSSRPIACLLSGGLDSSLVCAITQIHYKKPLETFSIGLKDSEDIKNANTVANYLGTIHKNIILTEDEFFDAIPQVIKSIASYDTTTVRASVGNYLIGKYIKENSKAKVIFNGDGSDELMGGYLYFNSCTDSLEFDQECKRLLSNIHYFDVLRSDKCISSHGLEPRTPFLDINFVNYYLSLQPVIRFANQKCEKFIIRNAFSKVIPDILPQEILWRRKEAFSDGVSSLQRSWFEIIQEKILKLYDKNLLSDKVKQFVEKENLTLEQAYYKYLFEENYKNLNHIIPYYWMPKFVNAKDASARTLKEY